MAYEMNRRTFAAGILATTMLTAPVFASTENNIEGLIDLTKGVLDKIDRDGYSFDVIREDVYEIFDVERIAKVVAGRGPWIAADDETKAYFVDCIARYLFSNYIGHLEDYGIDKAKDVLDGLKFKETKRGKWTFYKTVLFIRHDVPINVRTTGGKIVDVEASNISFVITIRDELKSIIRNEGLADTCVRLEELLGNK